LELGKIMKTGKKKMKKKYNSTPLKKDVQGFQGEKYRERSEHFFHGIDAEFDYISNRLNDLFSRVHSMIRNLSVFGLERALSSPPMLPEKLPPRKNVSDLVSFDSEVLRRFMLSREEPLVETTIDESRGELRILVLMPGVRKEDIELELTESMVTARSLAKGDNSRGLSVPLPVPVKMRSIETSYANGVLEVRLKLKSPKRYYKVKIR
jgi:HSP20 family molecular chaperone IbpA